MLYYNKWRIFERTFLHIRKKTRIYTTTIHFQYSTEKKIAQESRKEKEMKGNRNLERRIENILA